jgi:hypothetical protein
MWKPEKVERALFLWPRWKRSLVLSWIGAEELEGLPLADLRVHVRGALQKLDLPESILFEIYWISCAISDYCFDDWNTFNSIGMPRWLITRYDPILELETSHLEKPVRSYPPEIWGQSDVEYLIRRAAQGHYPEAYQALHVKDGRIDFVDTSPTIFLPPSHELFEILGSIKGKPRKRPQKPGRPPTSYDRLAVRCAALKDESNLTYVEIAAKLRLPITKPYASRQSDLTRHLVARGRELILEANDGD